MTYRGSWYPTWRTWYLCLESTIQTSLQPIRMPEQTILWRAARDNRSDLATLSCSLRETSFDGCVDPLPPIQPIVCHLELIVQSPVDKAIEHGKPAFRWTFSIDVVVGNMTRFCYSQCMRRNTRKIQHQFSYNVEVLRLVISKSLIDTLEHHRTRVPYLTASVTIWAGSSISTLFSLFNWLTLTRRWTRSDRTLKTSKHPQELTKLLSCGQPTLSDIVTSQRAWTTQQTISWRLLTTTSLRSPPAASLLLLAFMKVSNTLTTFRHTWERASE